MHDAAERGQCRAETDAEPAAGLDLSGRVFNGQRFQSVAFVVLGIDAGDDLTFAISVDGGPRVMAVGLPPPRVVGRKTQLVVGSRKWRKRLGCEPEAKRDCTRRATWR